MTDWKELGEVPDSEDDYLDFPESNNEEVSTEIRRNHGTDVWDVPVSPIVRAVATPSQNHLSGIEQPHFDSSTSSPLSSIDTDDGLPPLGLIELLDNGENVASSELGDVSAFPLRSRQTVNDLEASTLTSPDRPVTTSPYSHRNSDEARDIQEVGAGYAAIRYERSLRPRKPIQEHPYLLENAQYSKFLRKHGMKPVRLLSGQLPRTSALQDQEDEEFEEESQESVMRRLDNDAAHMDVPSSTPPDMSPAGNHPPVDSSQSSAGDTDDTSVLENELPALQDLLDGHGKNTSRPTAHHESLADNSSTRKRRRRNVIDSDPLDGETPSTTSPTSNAISQPRLNGKSKSVLKIPAPLIDIRHVDSNQGQLAEPLGQIMEISSDEEDGTGDSDGETDSSDVEVEGQVMSTMKKRIRGVLPASWVRLDQQAGLDKAKTSAQERHKQYRSPEREHRRGVAQLRRAPTGAVTSSILLDESEDETSQPPRGQAERYAIQTALAVKPAADPFSFIFDPTDPTDGDSSAMENDRLDHMLPSGGSHKKRRRTTVDAIQGSGEPKRRKLGSGSKSTPLKHRKPEGFRRIEELPGFRSLKQAHLEPNKIRKRTQRRHRGPPRGPATKIVTPQLGILDVIEPSAPRFLRIAARTARKHVSQGRASPSRKSIRLATREDHLDAVATLNSWKCGAIQQRASVTASANARRRPRQGEPLAERSVNRHPPNNTRRKPNADKTRKLVKHVSNGGSVSYRTPTQPVSTSKNNRRAPTATTTATEFFRPAVMEIDEPEQMTKFKFHARKRFLDRLYQNGHSASATTDSQSNSRTPIRDELQTGSYATFTTKPMEKRDGQQGKQQRYRKLIAPRRIDVTAPQYSHATDPVPDSYAAEPETEKALALRQNEFKLLGLGPYGTNYTHNFDVFPLHHDVFFHDSTILGGGLLESCATCSFPKDGDGPRPQSTFQLGNHRLCWGYWDDQVSSEMGVLLDYIADQMDTEIADYEPESNIDHPAVKAVDFLMKYVKDSINFIETSHSSSFVCRILECAQSLNDRVQSASGSKAHLSSQVASKLAKLYDRLLLTFLVILRMCRHDSGLVAEQIQVEQLLTSLAQTAMVNLKRAIPELRNIYAQLNAPCHRERGLRSEAVATHSWVLLMNILDAAAITGSSFWEVAAEALCPSQVFSSMDAKDHEIAWGAMFALLPLTEFHASGVLLPGKREDATAHVWAIPQRLLKAVFLLYQRSARQGPSFNNYCRALIARCHYLVQHWGWRHCVSIVGIIFDFFGAQSLAHLRNEEASASPSFLEHFNNGLAFRIEPEDRCFHVFLKFVAVAIHKLKEAGNFKAIKNLVFRIIPNHGRQHSKEENVLARDIAALRNHHDLLCTLFCAAPADLRPSLGLVRNLVPATSHKAACLISIRAWSQLSRFAVSSGEMTTLLPLIAWANSFFNQVLQQFESVAADVALQLSALGKDVCESISKDTVDAAIALNKTAVMDVLFASVAASLDVVRHAPDLQSITFAMNISQMQKVLTRFAVESPDLDWGILRACIGSLNTILSMIDDFKANDRNQESESQILNSELADDALMILDEGLSQSFFAAARCLIPTGETGVETASSTKQRDCTEQIVVLAARMTMRFISVGLIRIQDVFTKGKYRLFDDSPTQLAFAQREHLMLFVSTLLRYGIDDFSEAPINLTELWTLCLVTPQTYLRFESRLGEELSRQGMTSVPEAVTSLSEVPGYKTNYSLFEYAISAMREALRDSGPEMQKILVTDYSSALQMAMGQIRADLKAILTIPAEHEPYVLFVQNIVALIKAHGSDICAVDNYFYQSCKEYWPSAEDPQLQIAGLMSYGLRLQEGDTKHTYQLFHMLFSNAKYCFVNGGLQEEIKLLRGGMQNRVIARFILGKMLPAIFNAAFQERDGFPLLDVYAEALRRCFTKRAVSYELQADEMPAVCSLLRAFLGKITGLRNMSELSDLELHLVMQAVSIGNLLWPSLRSVRASVTDSQPFKDVLRLLSDLRRVFCAIGQQGAASTASSLPVASEQYAWCDNEVGSFTETIVQDVKKNWSTTNGYVSVRLPGRLQQAAHEHPSLSILAWHRQSLSGSLEEHIKEWNWWWETMEAALSLAPLENLIL